MSKSRMKKRRRNTSLIKKIPLAMWLVLGGAILVFGALFAGLRKSPSVGSEAGNEVSGAPALRVDQEMIDFGDVPLDQIVSAEFKLTNVGDRPLRISEKPYIEVVEGC
ncbi:MAG TPA: hypothetical protein VJL34_12405 [Anaerolineales bacterium]|nr:hypothetical protein [Anaerolineales bacterium]